MNATAIRLSALFVLYASMASPAQAYLDPATGSIIIQAVIGAVGTWVVYSRLFMARTKAVFGNIFKRGQSAED